MVFGRSKSACERCGTPLDKSWDRCPYCPVVPEEVVKMSWLVAVEGVDKGLVVPMDGRVMRIGNGAGNHVRLDDSYLSAHHAQVDPVGEQFEIQDLNSTNGIFLNDHRVDRVFLRDRDRLQLGRTTLVFRSWRSDIPATAVRHTRDAVVGWVMFRAGEQALSTVVLPAPVASLGTAKNCDIQFEDVFASSHHAQIVRSSRGFVLEDLASTNGSMINGQRTTNTTLADGDIIQVGRTELVFFAE